MGQFFQDNIPLITRPSITTLSLPATFQGSIASARIGGQGYTWSSALAVNTAVTGLGGLDTGTMTANSLYYIYLVVSAGVVGMVVSLNAPTTGPTGFAQYREIGRIKTFVGSTGMFYPANQVLGDAKQSGLTTPWITYVGELLGAGTATFVVSGLSRVNRFRIVNNSMDITFHRAFLTAGSGAASLQIPLPEGVIFNAADHPALENRVGSRYAFNSTTYVAVAAIIGRSSGIFLENTGTATYLKGSDIPAGYELATDIKGLSITELLGLYD